MQCFRENGWGKKWPRFFAHSHWESLLKAIGQPLGNAQIKLTPHGHHLVECDGNPGNEVVSQ
jgi:hypothetical protein